MDDGGRWRRYVQQLIRAHVFSDDGDGISAPANIAHVRQTYTTSHNASSAFNDTLRYDFVRVSQNVVLPPYRARERARPQVCQVCAVRCKRYHFMRFMLAGGRAVHTHATATATPTATLPNTAELALLEDLCDCGAAVDDDAHVYYRTSDISARCCCARSRRANNAHK